MKNKSALSAAATDVVQMFSSDLLNNQRDTPQKRGSAPDLSGGVPVAATAPFSCSAAGGDALNALGHFVVVYRPTAYT